MTATATTTPDVLTHERELTQAVDLCLPGGRRLNPAARGWSRRPLHRANLAGVWGRTKRWDYWALQCEDAVVSLTLADIDYLGLATIEWIDLRAHRKGGRAVIRPFARGVQVPDRPCEGRLAYRSRHLDLEIDYAPNATALRARWSEPDGSTGRVDVSVALPPGYESLNVVIPWSESRFQFTSKHQARPATGSLSFGGRDLALGGAAGEAWGILDVGRGRWPYRTRWNWGGGAGRSRDGRLVGLQIGGKWTAGTGFTENGVSIDGRLTKIGEELTWKYRWEDPMKPWRVRSADGALDATLTPVHDRHGRIDLGLLRTETHQVFGRWTGSVPDGAGSTLSVDGILGFAEESRSRW
jgi:hypothetical protein